MFPILKTICLLSLAVLGVSVCLGQEKQNATSQQLDVGEYSTQQLVKMRTRAALEMNKAQEADKLPEFFRLVEELIGIDRELLTRAKRITPRTKAFRQVIDTLQAELLEELLQPLAEAAEQNDRWEDARRHRQEILALTSERYGEKH